MLRKWQSSSFTSSGVWSDESEALHRNYNLVDHRGVILMCNWLLSYQMNSFHSHLDFWFMIDGKKKFYVRFLTLFARKCIKMSHKLPDFTGNCTLGINQLSGFLHHSSEHDDENYWCNNMIIKHPPRFMNLIKKLRSCKWFRSVAGWDFVSLFLGFIITSSQFQPNQPPSRKQFH